MDSVRRRKCTLLISNRSGSTLNLVVHGTEVNIVRAMSSNIVLPVDVGGFVYYVFHVVFIILMQAIIYYTHRGWNCQQKRGARMLP